MSQTNPAALSEGSVFHGRYQIVRCINAGGMGAVYECVHLTTRKRRALKVMLPQMLASPGMRERFELEARVTADIESDHIVETFDAGVDDTTGAPFLVMELLRGEDLDRRVKRGGPLDAAQVVTLLASVAPALEMTHAAGIVHRDLKPQNLFLTTRDDGPPRLKILDFGIAKVVADGTKTAHQTAAVGTPLYMAPEQTTGDGRVGPAADRYALGHIAYTLLVGEPYWLEEQALPLYAFLTKMIAGPVEPPSARAARRGVTLPVAFDAWFLRATARSPGDRFDRASTQVEALAEALGAAASPAASVDSPPPSQGAPGPVPEISPQHGGSVGALSSDPIPAAPVRSRAPRVGLAVVAVAIGAVGVLAAARAFDGRRPEPAPSAAIVSAAPSPTSEAPAVALPTVTASAELAPSAAPTAEPTASAASVLPVARVPAKPAAAAKPSASPAPTATATSKPSRITTPL